MHPSRSFNVVTSRPVWLGPTRPWAVLSGQGEGGAPPDRRLLHEDRSLPSVRRETLKPVRHTEVGLPDPFRNECPFRGVVDGTGGYVSKRFTEGTKGLTLNSTLVNPGGHTNSGRWSDLLIVPKETMRIYTIIYSPRVTATRTCVPSLPFPTN